MIFLLDKVLRSLADDNPALAGVAVFVLAALLVWGFYRWMDKPR